MSRTPRTPTHPLDLYEAAVTNPGPLAKFLAAVHGHAPRTLGEDFSGSAALARAWTRLGPAMKAIAVDRDAAALAHHPPLARLTTRACDVMAVRTKADIIAATNFPVLYWHTRAALTAYLRHVRTRLKARGVFVADLYGGPGALTIGRRTNTFALAGGARLRYTWHQQRADPLTARVFNAIHFRITRPGAAPVVHNAAFTYDWRLWSIPELRDAMLEAGFRSVDVYDRLGGAVDHLGNLYVRPAAEHEMDADWVAYVAARI